MPCIASARFARRCAMHLIGECASELSWMSKIRKTWTATIQWLRSAASCSQEPTYCSGQRKSDRETQKEDVAPCTSSVSQEMPTACSSQVRILQSRHLHATWNSVC